MVPATWKRHKGDQNARLHLRHPLLRLLLVLEQHHHPPPARARRPFPARYPLQPRLQLLPPPPPGRRRLRVRLGSAATRPTRRRRARAALLVRSRRLQRHLLQLTRQRLHSLLAPRTRIVACRVATGFLRTCYARKHFFFLSGSCLRNEVWMFVRNWISYFFFGYGDVRESSKGKEFRVRGFWE